MEKNEENKIILEKIKKLIALSESPNESEAAAALSKVQVLLAKHDLTMTDINRKSKNSILEKSVLNKKRLRNWESALLSTVMKSTYTEAIHKSEEGKVYIIGREINVAAAENMFLYLHETIKKLSKKYNPVIRHADSFRYGIVININERLTKMDSESFTEKKSKEIVVSMKGKTDFENSEYLSDTYGKVRRKKINNRVDPESYGLGQKVGNKISLNKQIK